VSVGTDEAVAFEHSGNMVTARIAGRRHQIADMQNFGTQGEQLAHMRFGLIGWEVS